MSHAKQLRDFDSFIELATYFDSEQKAVDYLATLRWNGQPQCPYCGHDHAYELKGKQRLWKCEECGNEGCEMHVHHLTYERLGNEKSTDLKIVCVYCHQYIHGKGPEVTHISEGLTDMLTDMT